MQDRGLLESVSGFGEVPIVLGEAYDSRVITPFTAMKHGDTETKQKYDEVLPTLIPELFQEYGPKMKL